jgi:hypothetical protein
MSELYERDFYGWANEQARLLRERRLTEADLDHIAEEIESMGRSEKRELVSRLTVLLLHLLKWQTQPGYRGASWELSANISRDELAGHLQDNASLKAQLPDALQTAYRRATLYAARETGLAAGVFPGQCPWSFEQAMEPSFWPQD